MAAMRLRSDLRACTIDGVFYQIMVGIAEVFLPNFVIHLRLGPIAAGLVVTVPVLLGSVIQLWSPGWIRWAGSYARWTAGCAFVQALAYVPLAALAWVSPEMVPESLSTGATWLLAVSVFALLTLYWAAGLACGPAWSSQVGAIIPRSLAPNYFAYRSRILQAVMLVAILGHGTLMEELGGGKDSALGAPATMRVFALVFVLAAACRVVSAVYLLRYSEPEHTPRDEVDVSLPTFISRSAHSADGRLLLYALAVTLAAGIAQPFFNPFMLDVLGLDRTPAMDVAGWTASWYSVLLATAYVGRILALPVVGKIAAYLGPRKALLLGGVGIVPMSLFWLWPHSMVVLIVAQLASGVFWAAYELGLFLMYFEAIPRRERIAVLTRFTLVNEFARTSGSLVGAGTLSGVGTGESAYRTVFLVSAACRLLTLGLLARVGRHKH
ncbi:MAG: hypothetical protein IPK69_10150 [Phycisphaerales bacterium]|nr:MAG: hypothetical protein IPK69_10150 [Phycisphaerales bacterium]